MLKTGLREVDLFRTYYWHGATLVGKYRLPQLLPTQSIPHDVISFNERRGISNPENHWVDFSLTMICLKIFGIIQKKVLSI